MEHRLEDELPVRLGDLADTATAPTDVLLMSTIRKRAAAQRRHRRGAALGVAAMILAGGVGGTTLLQTTPSQSGVPAATELAAYSGVQVPGFRVAWMPKGFAIESSDKTNLVMAGTTTNSKLLVGLMTKSAGPPAGGTAQDVGGLPGRLFNRMTDEKLSHEEQVLRAKKDASNPKNDGSTPESTMSLYYEYQDGKWMMIQVPRALGWNGSIIARFASGVTVLAT